MAPLAKADDPHIREESKIIDFDDDMDSGSDYDRYELSIKRKVRANTGNPNKKHENDQYERCA